MEIAAWDYIAQNGIAYAVLVVVIWFLYKDREHYRTRVETMQSEKNSDFEKVEKENDSLKERIKILEETIKKS